MGSNSQSNDLGSKDVILEELRREYDQKIEQLELIDKKAIQSVRTAVLVIGFIIAAAGIATREGDVSVGWIPVAAATIGLLLLIATVLIGSAVYLITEYPGEINKKSLPSRRHRTHKDELIKMYRRWSGLCSKEIEENNKYMTYTIFSKFLGILSLLISGLQIAVPNFFPECGSPGGLLCLYGTTIEIGVAVGVIALVSVFVRQLFKKIPNFRKIIEMFLAILLWLSISAGTELLLSTF